MKRVLFLALALISFFAEAQTVITKGGVYSGTFESFDSNVPAVKITTAEKVVIEYSTIISAGNLIQSTVYGADITVRNSKGKGLTPTVEGRTRGRFIYAENFSNLIVENNEFEHTSGIYGLNYIGDGTIKVRFNKSKNIDGRNNQGTRGDRNVCFLQLNKCFDVKDGEISWNYIFNEYGNSLVEDNINFFISGGTQESPLLVHDNIIDGAYNLPGSTSYNGGGIMVDGAWNKTTLRACAFIKTYNNQIIRTSNYGLGIAGGNNIEVFNNRVLNKNLGPNGEKLFGAGNNGLQVWNYGQAPSTVFFNNSAHDNLLGYINQATGKRQDAWFGSVTLSTGSKVSACTNCLNTPFSGTIDKTVEDAEILSFFKKAEENKIILGIIPRAFTIKEIAAIVPGAEKAETLEEIIKIAADRAKEEGRAQGKSEGRAETLEKVKSILNTF